MKHSLVWLSLTVALFTACSQPISTREKSTLTGGFVGGAAGSIIGAAVGKPAAGAAIGTALGAGTGALVGDQLQQRDTMAAEQQQHIERQRQELARNRQVLEELKRRNLDAQETDRGVIVNLPDVLFAFNRADLTTNAWTKVRDIADVLNDQAHGRFVSIEGHADAIGSETYNQQLSERRAESVAIALQQSGVSSRRLTIHGYGERFPVAPNTYPNGSDNPAGRAQNRRVEVVIKN